LVDKSVFFHINHRLVLNFLGALYDANGAA
jgi:hypothetical protein